MKPTTASRFKFGVTSTLIISGILPIAGSALVLRLFAWHWHYGPLHHIFEGAGAFIAVTVAIVLLLQMRVEQNVAHFIWISSALIGGGLLDGFHASFHVGNEFVWTHSIAILVGGMLFALVWLPDHLARSRVAKALPGLAAVAATFIGTFSIAFPGRLPIMAIEGVFTPAAKAINVIGGLFFISAGACFLLRYRTRGSKNDLLFANLCLLFGGSGVLFTYSSLWDAAWWYWHLLRLLAYFVVLGYAFSAFVNLQEKLRGSEARSRALLNAIPDLIFRYYLDGTLLDFQAHDGFLRSDIPSQMIVGSNIYNSPMPREVIDQVMAASGRAVETGDVQTVEFTYPKASELRHYEAQIVTSGTNELVAVVRNITERKRAEENTRQMAAIVASSDDAIYSKTLDGVIVSWNRGAERIYGYSAEEVLGRPVSLLAPPDLSDEPREVMRRVNQGETIERFKTETLHKDGRRFAISLSVYPIRNAQGEIAGSFTISRDVTEQRKAEEAQRESEEQVRLLLNFTAEGIFGADTNGNVTFANPASLRLLGFDDPNQLLGRNIHLLCHHSRADGTPYPLEECRGSRAIRRGESIHVDDEVFWRTDGTSFPVEYWSYPVRRHEEVVGGVVTFVDITERKRAENKLQKSEKWHHAIIQTAMDGFWVVDTQGLLLEVNETYCRMSGYSEQELVGMLISNIEAIEGKDETSSHIEKIMAQGEDRFETRHRRKDGSVFDVEIRVQYRHDEGGRIVTFLRDITERKRAEDKLRQNEADLRRSQAELRALAAQLISAKEEENKRLARELHDVFSQRLAVLGMGVSALQQQLASVSPSFSDKLRVMGDEIGRLAKDVHQLSRQMHPSILDDLGLTAALRAECGAFSQQHGVSAKFLPTNVPDLLPGEIALSLYRIVQESFWNIAKHAQAHEVRLIVSAVGGELMLAVEDDGRGFELGQIKGRGGLGLVSMEERARLVGGSFFVQSQPGKGTRVEVRIPLSRSEG